MYPGEKEYIASFLYITTNQQKQYIIMGFFFAWSNPNEPSFLSSHMNSYTHSELIFSLSYLPTPSLRQDMTQGQFLSGV